jgi:7-carboxy-7-deazaguanine synthase
LLFEASDIGIPILPAGPETRIYAVKEIFASLQGEGAMVGRAAVFCRFSGCNLWSGREEHRAAATCRFCDTDFVGTDGEGGGKFTSARDLVAAIAPAWRGEAEHRYVVFTGGEPLLQLDEVLIAQVHEAGFTVAVETNGTIAPPAGVDWLCVSPKAGAPLALERGSELKLVYPQEGLVPEELLGLDFEHFFLQPMDGPNLAENIAVTAAYCLAHPPWRLSLQIHKWIGLP